jgi:hypothetical protein
MLRELPVNCRNCARAQSQKATGPFDDNAMSGRLPQYHSDGKPGASMIAKAAPAPASGASIRVTLVALGSRNRTAANISSNPAAAPRQPLSRAMRPTLFTLGKPPLHAGQERPIIGTVLGAAMLTMRGLPAEDRCDNETAFRRSTANRSTSMVLPLA